MEGWLCETIGTTQQGLETPSVQTIQIYILYYTILYYTILYYTILYYTILYYTESFQSLLCSIYGETEANSYSIVVQLLQIGIPLNRWSVWVPSDVRVRAGIIM